MRTWKCNKCTQHNCIINCNTKFYLVNETYCPFGVECAANWIECDDKTHIETAHEGVINTLTAEREELRREVEFLRGVIRSWERIVHITSGGAQ